MPKVEGRDGLVPHGVCSVYVFRTELQASIGTAIQAIPTSKDSLERLRPKFRKDSGFCSCTRCGQALWSETAPENSVWPLTGGRLISLVVLWQPAVWIKDSVR